MKNRGQRASLRVKNMGGKRSAFNSIVDVDFLYNLSDTAFAILGDDSDYVDKVISWMRDREELDQHCKSITTHNLSLDVGLSIVSLGFGILIGLIVTHERFRNNRLYNKSDDFFLQQLINLGENNTALSGLSENIAELKEYLEHHGDHNRIFTQWWRNEFNPLKAEKAKKYQDIRNNAIKELLKEKFAYKVIFKSEKPDLKDQEKGIYLYQEEVEGRKRTRISYKENFANSGNIIESEINDNINFSDNTNFSLQTILDKKNDGDEITNKKLIYLVKSAYLNEYITAKIDDTNPLKKPRNMLITWLMFFWAIWYAIWQITGSVAMVNTAGMLLMYGLSSVFFLPILPLAFFILKGYKPKNENIEPKELYIKKRLFFIDQYFNILESQLVEVNDNEKNNIEQKLEAQNLENKASLVAEGICRLENWKNSSIFLTATTSTMFGALVPMYIWWPISLLLIGLGGPAGIIGSDLIIRIIAGITAGLTLTFLVKNINHATTRYDILSNLIKKNRNKLDELKQLEKQNFWLESEIKKLSPEGSGAIEHLATQDAFYRKMSTAHQASWTTIAKKIGNRVYAFASGSILGMLFVRIFFVSALINVHSAALFLGLALALGVIYGLYSLYEYNKEHYIERDKKLIEEVGLRTYGEKRKQQFLISKLASIQPENNASQDINQAETQQSNTNLTLWTQAKNYCYNEAKWWAGLAY